ncbi:DUF6531 domain-containing protein [Amycolatopsis cynarae]|uniref:DUF6531 domain-containing protein n=1 Tax=Amycolatopsis cynarae TaxID=2995223 RepID=A0ABY7B613_9PSEU|nr:DUF6531 domain-containing protein [Amycolatopsis sp. HUAS 11-8]WAL67781.1 DUF6531 domain-containing protein [Amycolatopsis sp. HUAS 11-8]
MSNPLVAQKQDSTTWHSGINVLDDAAGVYQGVQSGSWIEGGIAALGTGMDLLTMAMNPVGTLISYGLNWLIEHVKPLKDALDQLAGDADQIAAYSQTWKNVAQAVQQAGKDLAATVEKDTANWSGQAADTYRANLKNKIGHINAASTCAETIAIVVQIVGVITGAVRGIVRDMVTQAIGDFIQDALEEVCSLGLGTPVVVAQVVEQVSAWMEKIGAVIKKLINSVEKLRPMMSKLEEIFAAIKKVMSALHGRPGEAEPHLPGESTHASSAHDTPASPNPETPLGSHTTDGTTPSGTEPSSGGIKDNIGEPRDNAVPADQLKCAQDPVDVASGRMVMAQTDVQLLGVLPVVLRRVHLSSYRAGRCFGPSWASTFDQRLEIEDETVYLAADDGTLQSFPNPAPGFTSLPDEGPRRLLERAEDGGYRLTDFEQRVMLCFEPDGPVRRLASITDRNGNRVEFQYTGSGAPTEIRHSSGYRIRVECDGDLVSALHLCDSGDGDDLLLIWYRYQNGRLTEVVNSSGRPLRFDYDPTGRVTGWTDRNGGWYRYFYDGAGRVVRTEGPQGAVSGTMEYDLENRVTYSVDSLGGRTAFHLNEAKQVVREVDPLGNETRFEWDRYDRLLSRTDPLGRVERYRYDEDGNLTTITRADGSQHLFEYNEFRLPVTSVGPDGAVIRREFDEHGNVTKVVDPAGNATEFAYDERGGWTVGGGLAWRGLPDGSVEKWVYDGEGNSRVYTDPMGRPTHTEYTHFDLPSVERRPDGTTLEFTYDTELRLIGVTNELGLQWRREYDPAGNLVRETDFNGRTIAYRYDAAGQLVERVNGAGEATRFTYDALGNLVERRNAAGVATFGYDPAGRLVYANDGATALFFQRDALGRVLTETCNGHAVVSSYDALGRRVRRRTPSGAESRWEYDANDQPVVLHTAGRTLRFTYDPAGQELQRHIGAGVVLAQRWNANRQLVSQTIAGSSGRLQHRSYTYRADGFLAGIDDGLAGRRSFDLDAVGRVTAVTGAEWRENYRYDRAGNITGASWPADPADGDLLGERRYDGTLVQEAGTTRYQRDAQGRVVLRQRKRLSRKPETWRYFWDPDDRLVGVRTPDGTNWRYSYDPLGRRIAKQRLGADGHVVEQIDFRWDGVVLAEQAHRTGSDDVRVTVWDHEPDRFTPVTQNERSWSGNSSQEWFDEQFYAIVTDLTGTPSELVDERGAIAWFRRANLWGRTITESMAGAAATLLRFPGQYADPETGFNYNYFRHYDPDTGHYVSADPLGLAAGPHHYRYTVNPLQFIDPLGLVSCTLNDYADSLRGSNQASTPRVASEYTTPSGQKYRAHNREGVPIPDHLRNEMEQIAPLSNRHGACAEVNALSKAYLGERAAAIAAGKTPEEADALARQAIRGGNMESVRVRPSGSPVNSHGTPIDPCPPFCTPLLRRLGISW